MEIDFPSVRRSLWKLPPARRKIEAARSRPFVCDRSLLFVAPSTRPARVFRNTACKSVRFAVVAQGSHHQELPTGMPDPLLHQCFPALYFQFLTANCCAQVHMGVADVHLSAYRQPFSLGLMTSAVRWRIPEKCAESLVSRENARSAVSVAASVALRARSAAANAG